MTDVKKRIERLESDICPRDTKYGVLIYANRNGPLNPELKGNNYMKDGKYIGGYVHSVMEWANGKVTRWISPDSEEGQRILKELGYQETA